MKKKIQNILMFIPLAFFAIVLFIVSIFKGKVIIKKKNDDSPPPDAPTDDTKPAP